MNIKISLFALISALLINYGICQQLLNQDEILFYTIYPLHKTQIKGLFHTNPDQVQAILKKNQLQPGQYITPAQVTNTIRSLLKLPSLKNVTCRLRTSHDLTQKKNCSCNLFARNTRA
jgi:hypothetical protein